MKYISKIRFWIFGIFCFILFDVTVSAASVSVKASDSSITKGETVTFTATVSSNSALVSIEGSLSCSGAGVDGGTSLTFDDSSNSVYSKSFTYTAKPRQTGTVTCTISGGRVTDMGSGSWQKLNSSSVSVAVKDPVVIPPVEYSSDNNLSSLSVDGYDINPKFNKNTLEYKLELDQSIEKIKVNAKANHAKASVSGTGEKKLTPGENTIEIKVKAENGNQKIYKIIVTVKDLNPINLTINDKKYTVVKKNNGVIEKLEHYEESSVKIDNQDVLCYQNDKTGIKLVILKDEDNKVSYYVYDVENNKYQLYKEFKFGSITLYLLDLKKDFLPDGYQSHSLTIGDEKIDGYKLNEKSDFYLIYAMNVENGNKSLYLYDKVEGTVQRYDEEISKYFSTSTSEMLQNYKNYLAIALSVLGALVVVLVVVLVMNCRLKKGKIRKNKLKI